MNLQTTLSIFCDAGVRSSLPVGSQVNPSHTQWNRRAQQKGPDKGGVAAGGPGSGRHPEYGQFKQDKPNQYSSKNTQVTVYPGTEKHQVYEQNINPTGHRREKMGQSQPRKIGQGTLSQTTKFLKDKYGIDHQSGDIKSASKSKTKALNSEAAGSQSESYTVEDYMDRVLHRFKTRDEAEHASAGNRYTRVKTERPAAKEFDLSPVIKKPFGKIKSGRRTESGSQFPTAPQGR